MPEVVRREQSQRLFARRLKQRKVHGNLIVYESLSEFFTVESGAGPTPTAANPGGRVRVVIQPKAPPADTTTPAPPPRLGLKSDGTLSVPAPPAPAPRR